MANKYTEYEILRNDILLVGLVPDWSSGNYEGHRHKPPFYGPTRRDGHIRAVIPEDWTPEKFLEVALQDAKTRGWKLKGSEESALSFLKNTYYPIGKYNWYGTYGVLWFDVPEEA